MKNYRKMLEEVGGYENELIGVPAATVRDMIDEIENLMAATHKPPKQVKVPMGIRIHPGIKQWLSEQPESAISIIEQSLKDCHQDLAEYLEVYGTIHKLRQAE